MPIELRHKTPKTAKVEGPHYWKGGKAWSVDCACCGLEPMIGLTYEGAVNLAETHNREQHGDA